MTDPNEYFQNRRTIRKYDAAKPVSLELIDSLLEKAAQAPNTGNMQIYSVVVTTSPEGIKALGPAHFNQPAIANAPCVLTFCLDFNRFNKWCEASNCEGGLNNLQGFTWGVMDTAIFAQQFVTLAEMNGLGTCYLGTTTFNAELIKETLDLPKGVVPVITVTVGYPAEDPGLTQRLPLKAIVHHEKYADPTFEQVKELYAEEESLPVNKKFVEENGKENLAQVFAQVRYPKEMDEQFSRVYLEFLKNQGISLG